MIRDCRKSGRCFICPASRCLPGMARLGCRSEFNSSLPGFGTTHFFQPRAGLRRGLLRTIRYPDERQVVSFFGRRACAIVLAGLATQDVLVEGYFRQRTITHEVNSYRGPPAEIRTTLFPPGLDIITTGWTIERRRQVFPLRLSLWRCWLLTRSQHPRRLLSSHSPRFARDRQEFSRGNHRAVR